jgi:N-acyl-D-amino-acid deacylase
MNHLSTGLVALLLVASPAHGQSFDLLIRGGRVLDGTGNPWFYADVGVRNGDIVAVGALPRATADRVVEASGLLVVPGFIDLHSHADGPNYGPRGLRSQDPRRRAAPNLVAQGITTVVVNQDGRSLWPIAEQRQALEALGFGPNVVLMIGHGTIRRLAMGDDFRREATPAEVDRLRALVRRGMDDGAMGMTSGLEYVPGRWSNTEEMLAVVGELAPYGGVYVTHERASGADPMWYLPSDVNARPTTFLEAVAETIEIAERTGVTSVQSHIKARGADYWGSSHAAIQLIERARMRGVNIWADQYPYNTTGSDGSTVLIPGWAIQGDRSDGRPSFAAALRRVLEAPDSERKLRGDIRREVERRGGAENILVMEYPDRALVGKTIADLAAMFGVSPVDVAIKLQLEGDAERRGGAQLRGFSLSEYDVESYAAMPWVATATDGWVSLPEDGLTHVRVYGTFPRKIAYYAMERGVQTVADAVRSSTSLPAQIMGFEDRGTIREGMRADIVILDLETLADRATFFEPHQFPTGVEYVMIEGEFVVDGGEVTGALPGEVLLRNNK